MGSAASVMHIDDGIIHGRFLTASGNEVGVDRTKAVIDGGKDMPLDWINPFTFTLNLEDGTEELWVYVADKGGYYRFDERATPVNAVQQVYGRAEYFVRRPDGHSIIPLPEHCTPFVGLFRDMAINSDDVSQALHATLGAVMLQWLNPYTFYFKAGSEEQAQIWTYSSLLDAYLEIGNWDNALSEAKNNPTRAHKRLVNMMVPQQVSCAGQQEEEECVDAGVETKINKSIEVVSKAQQNVSKSPAADSAPCSASAAAAPGEPGMPSPLLQDVIGGTGDTSSMVNTNTCSTEHTNTTSTDKTDVANSDKVSVESGEGSPMDTTCKGHDGKVLMTPLPSCRYEEYFMTPDFIVNCQWATLLLKLQQRRLRAAKARAPKSAWHDLADVVEGA